ncbi:MAG: hypothetical protein P1Q69_18030, partial [Candidatus Thorarchaeota archaeon]|nr:hypothetical protein [Candidatus Thorarchaeota archaeon]
FWEHFTLVSKIVQLTMNGVGLEAGESVYLTFEHFDDETLVYDPILGIASDSSVPVLADNTILLIIGGVAVVALVAIVLKVKK